MNNLDEYEKAFSNFLGEEPLKISLLYQLSSISSEVSHERLIALIKDAAIKGIEKKYPISFSYFLVHLVIK